MDCYKHLYDTPELHKKCIDTYPEFIGFIQEASELSENSHETSEPRLISVWDIKYPYVKKDRPSRNILYKELSNSLITDDIRLLYHTYKIIDAPTSLNLNIDFLYNLKYKKISCIPLPELLLYYFYNKYGTVIPQSYNVDFENRIIELEDSDNKDKTLIMNNKYKNVKTFQKIMETILKKKKNIYGIDLGHDEHAFFIFIDTRITPAKLFLFDPIVGNSCACSNTNTRRNHVNQIILKEVEKFNGDDDDKIDYNGLLFYKYQTKLFQSIEQKCIDIHDIDADGYCQSWVLFAFEILMVNIDNIKPGNDNDIRKLFDLTLKPLNDNPILYRKFIVDYIWSRMIDLIDIIDENHKDYFNFIPYKNEIKKHFINRKIIPIQEGHTEQSRKKRRMKG